MVHSVEYLKSRVSQPLALKLGSKARLLTVEAHGDQIRGLAICPGKIVSYVLCAQSKKLFSKDVLTIHSKA